MVRLKEGMFLLPLGFQQQEVSWRSSGRLAGLVVAGSWLDSECGFVREAWSSHAWYGEPHFLTTAVFLSLRIGCIISLFAKKGAYPLGSRWYLYLIGYLNSLEFSVFQSLLCRTQ